MADGIVQVPVDSTGKKIDTSELTVGAATVERQRIVVADPASATRLAGVTAAGALQTDGSAVTQPVSAAALPLPAGAATDAALVAIEVLLNGGLPALSSGRLPTAATQSGNWNTGARASSTATLSNVAANASSVSLLASNANRLAVVIMNDGTGNLLVKLGATASATSFTYKLSAGQMLELPTAGSVIYTGAIDGIWDVANGSARITELT